VRTIPLFLAGLALAGASLGPRTAVAEQAKGYFGVALRPMDDDTADRQRLSHEKGEIVVTVEPGGPADRAGIRSGDIILRIGEREVSGASTTATLIAALPPGARVEARVLRAGQFFTVETTLGRRPSEQQLASARAETPEARAESYVDDARGTIAAVNLRLKDRSIACDGPEAGESGFKIARVDGLMQGLVNIQTRFPPYMQAGVSRAIATLGMEAGRLRLEQADGFLAAGCNPQAATLYRFVLANFSSPVFEGLRQRAQVGVDDARSPGQ
jgi:serine protease Do